MQRRDHHDWASDAYVKEWVERQQVADPGRAERFQLMCDLFPFHTDARVTILDVGAGYGAVSTFILEQFPNATCIAQDGSEPMLRCAQQRLAGYGARIIRLDAFAYLHKEPGQPNFFNRPGTWEYLERVRRIAEKYDLVVFPEIHSEYGAGIHAEIAGQGYPVYDFFLPGLVLDALDRGNGEALRHWIADILEQGLQTINMLGSHDGIPMLDLRGKQVDDRWRPGLLDNTQIEAAMQRILDRGGRTKNLYDAQGKKIDYYQINATYFSALGEDERKLLLARAIQMFMPGVPQVWYLDLFAGKNDYAAADRGDSAKHKEINRTNLSLDDIEAGLKRAVVRDQLALIRLRNTSPAFAGELELHETPAHRLRLTWRNGDVASATLEADLARHAFTVYRDEGNGEQVLLASAWQ